MFHGIENRTSQMKMLTSAAEATLPKNIFEVMTVLFSAVVRPSMKFRDKLAHWTWGWSDSLPDDLLVTEPKHKLRTHMQGIKKQAASKTMNTPDVPFGPENIYAITAKDMDAALASLSQTTKCLQMAMGAVWDSNTPEQRSRLFDALCREPHIQERLSNRARKSDPRGVHPINGAG
jgi:hypothetical protein